ncbi:uncharacterized protein ACA1_276800 [Acanthamoeba castellanii str. Neff]|uniref:Uncharacterized protein n=1 Tax=Acanthamoeba castellanii (strain ATCC 30010 / Neff) TaxID=1257118 RepID=L8GQJ6_ACACF|nr:uncharacterized protein ACA1_276800 [Acanthamoeba castellanii str. Neff]ELR15444.1 hypothetical protein ACA1_276800 [Acanthamoeba castellanii str. Neff]
MTAGVVEDSGLTSLALASIAHSRSSPPSRSSVQIKPALRRPLRRHHRPWEEDEEDDDASSSTSSPSSSSSTAESWTNHGVPQDLTSRHRPLPHDRKRTSRRVNVKLETDLGGPRDHLHQQDEGDRAAAPATRTRAGRSRAKRVKVEEEPAQLLGETRDRAEQEEEDVLARHATEPRGKASPMSRPVPASPSRLPSLPSLLLPSAPFQHPSSHPLLPTMAATPTIFTPSPPSAPSSSSLAPQTSYYDAAVLHYYLSLAAWYSRPQPDQQQPQHPYPHLLPAISMSSTTTSTDETDKLALAAERRRRRSLTTPTATRWDDRQPLPEQRSPPSYAGQQAKSESDNYKKEKNEEPTAGGEGNERQATWRDRQGCFTFHTLESLEASKKKGGRVRLKWRKDP